MHTITLIALLLSSLAIYAENLGTYSDLTCDQYSKVYNAIDAIISNDSFSSFAIQLFVRLSFHDCVGNNGCDGCINGKDSANSGLTGNPLWSYFNSLYDRKFKQTLSRSDYFALAGHVALIRGVFNIDCNSKCPSLSLGYMWGRSDCRNSPLTTSIDGLPSAHGDYGEVNRVLGDMFGLETYEIVALMGAHNLGGAHPQFSGFKFTWQSNPTVLSNQYYKNLLSTSLTHENVGNKTSRRYEFVRTLNNGNNLMMLNVDASLLRDVTALTDNNGAFNGKLVCSGSKTAILEGKLNDLSNCDNADSATYVKEYANNLQSFYTDFSSAWGKMITYGRASLSKPSVSNGQVCGNCVPKGAFCQPGFSKSCACCKGYTCEDNVCQ